MSWDSGARKRDRRKTTGAHFTPPDLATVVAERLLSELRQAPARPLRVLDPSCGDGELLLAFARSAPPRLRESMVLIGVEQSEASLRVAEERLRDCAVPSVELIVGDFLKIASSSSQQLTLFEETSHHTSLSKPVDIIIANPPYVRTQVLGAARAQQLAKQFGLSGRVDLYHAFIVAMTRQLAPHGLLGAITSNRFITTRGGAFLREFLLREYDIIEILDLGDTRWFKAAVLPAVVVARRKPHGLVAEKGVAWRIPFVRIYEESTRTDDNDSLPQLAASVAHILRSPKSGMYLADGHSYAVAVGHLSVPPRREHPWALLTRDEAAWVTQVESRAACRLHDLARVRVGIKTTADEVFIRSDWETLPYLIRPEPELLRRLLSSDSISRWRALHAGEFGRRVLYTHEVIEGKRSPIRLSQFPRAAAYLDSHRKRLENRHYIREAKRMWYEIWVPQDPAAWRLPKLVFPDISPEPRFAYDGDGCIVDGNCYWITLLSGVDDSFLFFLMAVVNSRLIAKYHDLAFQNRLYAGRRRYLAQYVELYPVPRPSSDILKRLAALAREESASEGNEMKAEDMLEDEIEDLVQKAFGVGLGD